MRKLSCVLAAAGAVLAAVLFLVRRSAWFLAEQAKAMSDLAELVESAFWASLILVGLCLIFFLRSFRPASKEREEIQPPAPLEPEPWVCRFCGSANPVSVDTCQACGMPFEPELRDWVCPRCGNVNDPQQADCPVCGYGKVE